jgi:hypothetical protein
MLNGAEVAAVEARLEVPAEEPAGDTEAAQFLRLWTEVTDAPHVTLVAILPDTQVVHARTFPRGATDKAAAWIADHQATGRNVYFQPNETRADCRRKPGKNDMVAALCRFADIDPNDAHFPLAEERDRLAHLAAALAASDCPPTVIIDSGNGMQPIWAVAREILTPEVTTRVEAETAALERTLGAGGTHNIDRLLRLPGTTNFPNKAKLAKGRGITHTRLIFARANLYQPDRCGSLVNGLEAGLVRSRPASASTAGHTVDPPEVAALIKQLEQATAGRVIEDLADDLWVRLCAAMAPDPADHDYARRKRLADRWTGLVDDLTAAGRDDSRSGADMSLAAMLKAGGFDRVETGLALLAFKHGKANNEAWATETLRLRHVARTVLRSYEPAPDDRQSEPPRGALAERLWCDAGSVGGTAGAMYLERLALAHLIGCAELRFYAACPHPSGARLPALVAAVRSLDGMLSGVVRIYLRPDGEGLAAIEPKRAALGSVRGGAVRLASLEDVLAASELVVGIDLEEAASLGRLLRRPAWAAATAANLAAGITLPPEIRRVVIANVGGDGASRSAWFRLRGEGRVVRTATPNGDAVGFNEILRGRKTP